MAVVDQLESETSQPEGDFEDLIRQYWAEPGVPRHNQELMRWSPSDVIDMEVRDDEEEKLEAGSIANLRGHFAVFNRWTEIDSMFEGRFMESIAPGAFKKTFEENTKGMRCLFQHGRDSQVDMKPLGPIRLVQEDDHGARYHVPMLDTSYNRDLLPGLKAGLYGASFRFQVLQEDVTRSPEPSDYNPQGIEERVIREARVREFGPVTFPAYEDATAAARSGMRAEVGEWYLEDLLGLLAEKHPGVRMKYLAQVVTELRSVGRETPPPVASPPAPVEESSETASPAGEPKREPRAIGLRSTRLTAPRGALRTSNTMEEPQWKL